MELLNWKWNITPAMMMIHLFLWIWSVFSILYPYILLSLFLSWFFCPGSKAAPRPGGIGSAAAGQPGMEGEGMFSKILPGGAAEQAGKLGEGNIYESAKNKQHHLISLRPNENTSHVTYNNVNNCWTILAMDSIDRPWR